MYYIEFTNLQIFQRQAVVSGELSLVGFWQGRFAWSELGTTV